MTNACLNEEPPPEPRETPRHEHEAVGSSQWIGTVLTAIAVCALLGFLTGGLELLRGGGLRLVSSGGWKLGLVVTAGAVLFGPTRRAFARCGMRRQLAVVLTAYCILLFTDLVTRRESYFARPELAWSIPLLGLALVASAAAYRRVLRRPIPLSFPVTAVLISQLAAAGVFLLVADGRMLFNDDHPSFAYRLHMLRHQFPAIPFYNTEWNGGVSAREFFPSGILNLFAVSFPLVYLLPDVGTLDGAKYYSLIVPYVLVGVIPGGVFLASRLFGLDRHAAAIAALLSLAPTSAFFEFALLYGTIPFILASAALPLALVLVCRVMHGTADRRTLSLLAVALYLCSTWHLLAVAFVPVALIFVVTTVRERNFRALRRMAAVAVVIIALNLPSITTLMREVHVVKLAASNVLPGSGSSHQKNESADSPSSAFKSLLSESHSVLKRSASKVHPLYLLFAFPALAFTHRRSFRLTFGATALWLLSIACIGPSFKPQFELHRLTITLAFVLILPIAELLRRLLADAAGYPRWAAIGARSLVLGSVAAAPINAAAVYADMSYIRLTFAPDYLAQMADAIRAYGGSGRTFVTSFVLHELGATHYDTQDGGHVALLPALSGKPMYASHYYHVYWSTVDPIPESYRRRGDAGIEEFLDLVNATSVITFRREWARYCERKSDVYREVWRGGRFRLFTRRSPSEGYVLNGAADVVAHRDSIIIYPRTESVVLKFRYYPNLRVHPPDAAELFPQPVFFEDRGGGSSAQVDFVGVRRKPGSAESTALEIGF